MTNGSPPQPRATLTQYLDGIAAGSADLAAAAAVVGRIVGSTRTLSRMLSRGPLDRDLAALLPKSSHGDQPKFLDLEAHRLITAALDGASVMAINSEEAAEPLLLDPAGRVAVSMDPLDGSSNIDTNVPVGVIFSVLPHAELPFRQPGSAQLAAGFVLLGAQDVVALTFGDGTHRFIHDAAAEDFVEALPPAKIPRETREYAVNGSNRRHWSPGIQQYVEECEAGTQGPRGRDFNTRWLGSMIGEAWRILGRGGIYLYPPDLRPGYREGRLRLSYEASPIAWLIEQAGGGATDGLRRILDLASDDPHQHTGLVFGAQEEVEHIAWCLGNTDETHGHPLFKERGLFRG